MPIFPGTVSEIQHTEYRYDYLLKSETKDGEKIYENTLYTLINGRGVSDNLNLFYPSMEVVKALQKEIDAAVSKANKVLDEKEASLSKKITESENRLNKSISDLDSKVDNIKNEQNQSIENIANSAVIDDGNFLSGNGIYTGRYVYSTHFFTYLNDSVNSSKRVKVLGGEGTLEYSRHANKPLGLGDYTTDYLGRVHKIAGFRNDVDGNCFIDMICYIEPNTAQGHLSRTSNKITCIPPYLDKKNEGNLCAEDYVSALTGGHSVKSNYSEFGQTSSLEVKNLYYSNVMNNIDYKWESGVTSNDISISNLYNFNAPGNELNLRFPLFSFEYPWFNDAIFTENWLNGYATLSMQMCIDGKYGSHYSDRVTYDEAMVGDIPVRQYGSTFRYSVGSGYSVSKFSEISAEYLDGKSIRDESTGTRYITRRWNLENQKPIPEMQTSYKIQQSFYTGTSSITKFGVGIKFIAAGMHTIKVSVFKDENGKNPVYVPLGVDGTVVPLEMIQTFWGDDKETEIVFSPSFVQRGDSYIPYDSYDPRMVNDKRLSPSNYLYPFETGKKYYLVIEDIVTNSELDLMWEYVEENRADIFTPNKTYTKYKNQLHSNRNISWCLTCSNVDGEKLLNKPFDTYIWEKFDTERPDGELKKFYEKIPASILFRIYT